MATDGVAAVVLAAGRSSRLGQPKQILPYRDTTVLGATLQVVRSCRFDQVIVTVGGGASGNAEAVRSAVALDDVDVVIAEDAGSGCSSSLRSALAVVDPRAAGIVLLLSDQPGMTPSAVAAVVDAGRCGCDLAVCRYLDGIGHPFWLSRTMFGDLNRLHGDKGVWKLVDAKRESGGLCEVTVESAVPLDVDTWADYERLLAQVPS